MLRASLLPVSAAAGLIVLWAACADEPSGPPSYTVVYRLTASATGIAFDSVTYENPEGTLVKVATPALNWMVIDTALGGTWVQATAWVQSTNPGTATLKVTWTESGVSTASDSSKVTASAPGAFTLNIPRRQI